MQHCQVWVGACVCLKSKFHFTFWHVSYAVGGGDVMVFTNKYSISITQYSMSPWLYFTAFQTLWVTRLSVDLLMYSSQSNIKLLCNDELFKLIRLQCDRFLTSIVSALIMRACCNQHLIDQWSAAMSDLWRTLHHVVLCPAKPFQKTFQACCATVCILH